MNVQYIKTNQGSQRVGDNDWVVWTSTPPIFYFNSPRPMVLPVLRESCKLPRLKKIRRSAKRQEMKTWRQLLSYPPRHKLGQLKGIKIASSIECLIVKVSFAQNRDQNGIAAFCRIQSAEKSLFPTSSNQIMLERKRISKIKADHGTTSLCMTLYSRTEVYALSNLLQQRSLSNSIEDVRYGKEVSCIHYYWIVMLR